MEKESHQTAQSSKLVVTCWNDVLEALEFPTKSLLSLPNLTVKLDTGIVDKADLSFLPCIGTRITVDKLKEKGVGVEGNLEGEWILLKGDLKVRTFVARLGEEDFIFFDRLSCDKISPEGKVEKAIALLSEVLDTVKEDVGCNYAKYFVNNNLIVNGDDMFGEKEGSSKVRSELYAFIDDKIKKKVEAKTQVQEYLDNFGLRPFYGPAIHKLPVYKKEFQRYDWDEMYINVEQTKKELDIA